MIVLIIREAVLSSISRKHFLYPLYNSYIKSYIELIEKIKNIVNDEQLFNQVCLDCEWGNICHKK